MRLLTRKDDPSRLTRKFRWIRSLEPPMSWLTRQLRPYTRTDGCEVKTSWQVADPHHGRCMSRATQSLYQEIGRISKCTSSRHILLRPLRKSPIQSPLTMLSLMSSRRPRTRSHLSFDLRLTLLRCLGRNTRADRYGTPFPCPPYRYLAACESQTLVSGSTVGRLALLRSRRQ
jgi:hypothetical protein